MRRKAFGIFYSSSWLCFIILVAYSVLFEAQFSSLSLNSMQNTPFTECSFEVLYILRKAAEKRHELTLTAHNYIL